MQLQLSDILSIIQVTGLILTLLLVAIQLRNTNRIAESASYNTLTQIFTTFLNGMVVDKQLSNLWYDKGRYRPGELTTEEKNQFFILCSQYFGFHENLYIQNKRGVLPKEFYDGWQEDLKKNLHLPGFIFYWEDEGEEFTSSFRKFVDQHREKSKVEEKVGKTEENELKSGS